MPNSVQPLPQANAFSADQRPSEERSGPQQAAHDSSPKQAQSAKARRPSSVTADVEPSAKRLKLLASIATSSDKLPTSAKTDTTQFHPIRNHWSHNVIVPLELIQEIAAHLDPLDRKHFAELNRSSHQTFNQLITQLDNQARSLLLKLIHLDLPDPIRPRFNQRMQQLRTQLNQVASREIEPLAGYQALIKELQIECDYYLNNNWQSLRTLFEQHANNQPISALAFDCLTHINNVFDIDTPLEITSLLCSLIEFANHAVEPGGYKRPDSTQAALTLLIRAAVDCDAEINNHPYIWKNLQGSTLNIKELFSVLISEGYNIHQPCSYEGEQKSILQVAITSIASEEMVSDLLVLGADPDQAVDDRHETALMDCAYLGYPDIAERLLKHGADPDIVNNNLCSAQEIALNHARQTMLGAVEQDDMTLSTQQFKVATLIGNHRLIAQQQIAPLNFA